jgi:hypothetical protein
MSFEPCPSCKRHVSASDAACPFCGTRTNAVARGSTLAGRLTRAAVFAGMAACSGSAANQPPPPPPPVEYPFALPPAPAAGKASLSGIVRESGYRRAAVRVDLQGSNGEHQSAVTNDKGEYRFLDIEPGTYTVVADPGYRGQRPQDGPVMQPATQVELAADANEQRDLGVQPPPPYVPDTGPCCKPYGAPPARRRVV